MAVFSNKTIKVWSPDLSNSLFKHNLSSTISAMTQINDSLLLISKCDSNLSQLELLDATSFKSRSIPFVFEFGTCVTALKPFQFKSVQYIAVAVGSSVQLLNGTVDKLRNYEYLNNHNDTVTCLEYNTDSSLLASGSKDFSIRVWSMANYKIDVKASGHTDQIYVIALISNGSLLATSSRDNTIRIWNKTNLNLIANLTNKNTFEVMSIGIKLINT